MKVCKYSHAHTCNANVLKYYTNFLLIENMYADKNIVISI